MQFFLKNYLQYYFRRESVFETECTKTADRAFRLCDPALCIWVQLSCESRVKVVEFKIRLQLGHISHKAKWDVALNTKITQSM